MLTVQIFDKFTANMDMLEKTFPQSGTKDELMDRIKTGLETIKKEVNKAPEAPPRQDIYETVLGEGATDSNETNDEETPEDGSNSNKNPSPSHQTETVDIDGSNTTPANTRTVEKDMSVAELFKQLSSQNTDIKKDINEIKTNVAQDITQLRNDFKTLKSGTAKIMDQKHQQTINVVASETKKLQEQIDSLKKNQTNSSSMDREVTILGINNLSLPQPIQSQNNIPKQYMSSPLQTYLKESSEDESVLNKAEWLVKQFDNNPEVIAMDDLKPILNIINPRTTIINAIHNYQQQ